MKHRIAFWLLGLSFLAMAAPPLPVASVHAEQPADPGDDDDDDDTAEEAVPDPDDAPDTAVDDDTGDTGDATDAGAAGGDDAGSDDAGAAGGDDAGDDGAAAAGADGGDDDDGAAAGAGSAGGDDDDGAASGGGAAGGDDDDDDGAAAGAGGDTAGGTGSDDDGDDDNGAADDRNDGPGAAPGSSSGDAEDDDDDRMDGPAATQYAGVEDARQRARLDKQESIESDDDGFRYRRGELVALGVDDAGIARLTRAGFRVLERHRMTALNGQAVLLASPARVKDVDALVQLDGLIGDASHAVNHLFDRTSALVRSGGKPQRVTRRACPCRIGVIDTGVAGALPDLKRTRLVQQGFNGGTPDPALHGTIISSLIAGTEPAPGSRTEIIVGDVFSGPRRSAGSALAVVRALDWMATQKVAVINVSLSGANNPVVADAIARLAARGHIIVAAAGNDGPAAPPAFPAAYPGVVAVTAVDEKQAVYRYANRGSYIAFAARGVDVVGLAPDGTTKIVSGTSFAAPSVAIRLASSLKAPDPAAARAALAGLEREARDLGAPGRDPVFGAGFIADRP
ncbi:S8 family serine peptidase [Sandarakinorhabdus sp. AAP62]|uniref:S8 family serine peptidase n=1 Tax=Sandarakinorhabdus sp. AAP62 TaxID=1248916 RepID=UPI0002FAD817|nr:S8 family serine peptidase [Sandarakinorhabdus sp. AAP62]